MSNDVTVDLTYLPYVYVTSLSINAIFNIIILWDWKRRLMVSEDGLPLFNKPSELNWLTPCPWDKLSGSPSGMDAYSISRSMLPHEFYDKVLFIWRVVCLFIFLIVGSLVHFTMMERMDCWWAFFTNWNTLLISVYFLTVVMYSFIETVMPLW